MRSWLIAAAALALAAGGAAASPVDWSYTGVAENDVFDYAPNHTDRYYTHGSQLGGVSPELSADYVPPWIIRAGCFLESASSACRKGRDNDVNTVKFRWGLEAGQNIYTPADKTKDVDAKDRPYAGWAYAGVSIGSYSRVEINTLELQLGVVGPSSGSAWVQDHFHDIIHAARFEGWDHQLGDEVAFAIFGERRWRPHRLSPGEQGNLEGFAIDYADHLDFTVGTVQDSINIGRALRAGIGLGSDFGPPRIRPAPSGSAFIKPESQWSAYVFAGLDGRAVARDIFLDGNTLRNSPSVDKRWLVWEATSGAVLRWCGLRLGYTYVWQSEEFLGQRGPQKFGSWSVTLLPSGFGKACPTN